MSLQRRKPYWAWQRPAWTAVNIQINSAGITE